MKRAVLYGAILSATFALAGCPIYPSQASSCTVNSDCGNGWSCDPGTGQCYQPNGSGGSGGGQGCTRPSDCNFNETCGSDGQCDPGDCTFNGCVQGYKCLVSQGAWACVGADAGLPDSGPAPDSGREFFDSGPDGVGHDASPDSSGTGGTSGADAGGSSGAAGSSGATDAGGDAAPADASSG